MIPGPQLVEMKQRHIYGTQVRTTNENEMESATARIGAHWAQFMRDYPAVNPIALYTNYESDYRGEYDHVIGFEAGTETDGLKTYTIPAGQYLMFTGSGEMPAIVMETWKAVWDYFSGDSPRERSYATDFETYNAEGVSIYISIK